MLQAKGIQYRTEGDGSLRIDYGSAEVILGFRWSAGETVITVSAVVLDHISVDADAELRMLRSLNDRNRTMPFGKFFLDQNEGAIRVEYEILGDHLQEPELMSALVAVASLADEHDDVMQKEFGAGRRAAERLGRAEVPGF
jgi:hypothetical protein